MAWLLLLLLLHLQRGSHPEVRAFASCASLLLRPSPPFKASPWTECGICLRPSCSSYSSSVLNLHRRFSVALPHHAIVTAQPVPASSKGNLVCNFRMMPHLQTCQNGMKSL